MLRNNVTEDVQRTRRSNSSTAQHVGPAPDPSDVTIRGNPQGPDSTNESISSSRLLTSMENAVSVQNATKRSVASTSSSSFLNEATSHSKALGETEQKPEKFVLLVEDNHVNMKVSAQPSPQMCALLFVARFNGR